MCLHTQPPPAAPEQTARIACAAFPQGCLCLRLRDELGPLFTDEDFAELYPRRGQPAFAPWRLALVTLLQFLEDLPDRQAAHAVRARIDWKYALALELDDPGFHFSILSEFRARLTASDQGQMLLDKMLSHLRDKELLKERGRQRTDSTHVLASVRVMSRLELVTETLRAALNVLAVVCPDWLRSVAPAEWYTRYGARVEDTRLPSGERARREFAETVGRDGYRLLEALRDETAREGVQPDQAPQPPTPEQSASGPHILAAVRTLRQVWDRHFTRSEAGEVLWRPPADLPRAAGAVESPYDPEARHSNKRNINWTGYKVHLTETCDPDLPRLITDVHTTVATTQDVSCTADIQQSLADRNLLPERHLVDTGYVDAQLLVDSQRRHGVELFGPTRLNPSWQAREGGYDQYQFAVDWEKEKVTCPEGKVSVSWDTEKAKGGGPAPGGRARLLVGFSSRDCAACPSRSLCVRSATGKPRGRGLVLPAREDYEALQQARTVLSSEEGRAEYRRRAGIEGTLSQGVRRCDLRRARYRGLQKTHLQHMATAAGINALRAIRYLDGVPLAPTRRSRFARLRA